MQQKDFVEIEFTGKIKDGDIFDSNIKEDLEKANINVKAKPFIFRIGEGMFLKGVEDFLIGKELGKRYEIELTPENAFGNRNSKLIQIMPIKIFMQQKIRNYFFSLLINREIIANMREIKRAIGRIMKT